MGVSHLTIPPTSSNISTYKSLVSIKINRWDMATIIRDNAFTKIANIVKVDAKRRVPVPASSTKVGMLYDMYTNDSGQIVLDPQIPIPASELWIFENKGILATLDKSITHSREGVTVNRGSFARYVEDEA